MLEASSEVCAIFYESPWPAITSSCCSWSINCRSADFLFNNHNLYIWPRFLGFWQSWESESGKWAKRSSRHCPAWSCCSWTIGCGWTIPASKLKWKLKWMWEIFACPLMRFVSHLQLGCSANVLFSFVFISAAICVQNKRLRQRTWNNMWLERCACGFTSIYSYLLLLLFIFFFCFVLDNRIAWLSPLDKPNADSKYHC